MKVSTFTLERYRLGELSPEDMDAVNEILASDAELQSQMKELDESDADLRSQYPMEYFIRPFRAEKARPRTRYLVAMAAVLAAGIILPSLFFLFQRNSANAGRDAALLDSQNGIAVASADRPKGTTMEGLELSIYLKGNREIPLADQSLLSEGNTIQLAYTAPAGASHYGVIFSIDGRSVVTMHYPYRMGQNPLLVSGKHTFLNEAYTLDDAPFYEVFVMVISEEAISADTILKKAREIAASTSSENAIGLIEEKSISVFEKYRVETVTVLKNNKEVQK